MKPRDRGTIAHRITATIAEAEDVAIADLPPLGAVIDVDALEKLVRSSGDDTSIEFTYRRWNVSIHGDGRIAMTEPDSDTGPYASRCSTCGEEERGLDLDAAQDFFAAHADERHEVEIVRVDEMTPEARTPTEDTKSGEVVGTD